MLWVWMKPFLQLHLQDGDEQMELLMEPGDVYKKWMAKCKCSTRTRSLLRRAIVKAAVQELPWCFEQEMK
jgi:hypothetical protein